MLPRETGALMQIVFRSNVKDGRMTEYLEWVRENIDAVQEHAPDGWSYAGTYVTVYGFGSHEVENRWDVEDYANLAPGTSDEAWKKLVVESNDFFVSGQMQTSLVKGVDDVVVLE